MMYAIPLVILVLIMGVNYVIGLLASLVSLLLIVVFGSVLFIAVMLKFQDARDEIQR